MNAGFIVLGKCSAANSHPRGDGFSPELLLKGWRAVGLLSGNRLRNGLSLGSGAPQGQVLTLPDLPPASTYLLFHCHFLVYSDATLKVPLLHFLSDAR